jgi:hypothetical protein
MDHRQIFAVVTLCLKPFQFISLYFKKSLILYFISLSPVSFFLQKVHITPTTFFNIE